MRDFLASVALFGYVTVILMIVAAVEVIVYDDPARGGVFAILAAASALLALKER